MLYILALRKLKMKSNPKNIFIHGPITAAIIADSIAHHSTKKEIGAHSIFLGQVRADMIDNKMVRAIEYTSYEPMAIEVAHEIREGIFEKYDLTCMHIYHSLGEVKAGEICLFIFTSSKHRKAAIDSCAELVERIKKDVPIWGKELFDTNESQWKKNNI